MRIYDIKQKEVINICNCQRLGYVADVEFDPKCGCIEALVVPGPCKLWGVLGRDQEYIIPFCKVHHIGPDVILVEIEEEKCLEKGKYV
ncbi:MAG: YlmC/YmxH family sporulation protein [Lachnospiraceae bacterium]|nr:YlmC/YmxH family sporulation protein [Lachnospiraceae bacterium]